MTIRILALVSAFALVGCRGADTVEPAPIVDGEGIEPGSDLERLQGMWEIVEFQTANPRGGPDADKRQAIRLTFVGNKLIISIGTDWKEHFTVTLDPTKEPKQMTVVEVRDGSAAAADRSGTATEHAASAGGERAEWIYKFDGDTLVIAVADPNVPRPTTFTPRARAEAVGTAPAAAAAGRVDIVTLRKTTVAASPGPRYGTAAGYGTYRSGTSGRTYTTATKSIGTARYGSSPSYSQYPAGTSRGPATAYGTKK